MFKLLGVLEEIDSPINGKIKVIKDLQGKRIVVGGISQSGWLVKSVWNKSVGQAKKILPRIENVLILGLGAGSVVEVVNKHYPLANITGVDIDSKMVKMGKKHLQLGQATNLKTIIEDARLFLERDNPKFDLILVDLFKGEDIPEDFKKDIFLKKIQKLLKSPGVVIFNHLYSYKEKEKAKFFEKKLSVFFANITNIYPEANIMFLCFVDGNFAVKNTAKYNKHNQKN